MYRVISNAMNTSFPNPLGDDALASTWHTAWSTGLGLLPPQGLFAELMTAWSEPHRSYHDPRHLRECLALWRCWWGLSRSPGELAIALWFHDAVYVPGAADNELQSAAWAARSMTRAGADSESAQRVHDLIMATRHDVPVAPVSARATAESAPPVEATDTRLMLDIDLAILRSPPARFEGYDRDVRQEYAAVSGRLYRARRSAVLRGFLARPRIYGHPPAFVLLEAQARINLTGAVSRLAQ